MKRNKKIILSIIGLLLILLLISYMGLKIDLIGVKKVVIDCQREYEEEGAEASFLGISIPVRITSNLVPGELGTYKIVYSARNFLGMTKKKSRVIKLVDQVGPVITLNGDNPLILKAGDIYKELGATAKDYLDGDVSSDIEISGIVNTARYGNYSVTYKVKDKVGNISKMVRYVIVKDKEAPSLTLKGDKEVTLLVGSDFKEPGYIAVDNKDGNITNDVKITGDIDFRRPGDYELIYEIVDSSGNKTEEMRKIKITKEYKDSYNNIDNAHRTWWSSNKYDNKRPVGAFDKAELAKYNAYFLGPDEKIIYLTFDEGSNNTYLKEIVDVLDRHDVKATFFFCGHYVKSNPEMMKQLVQNGHSVGNHTSHHLHMPTYATKQGFSKYLSEIKDVEDYFKQITGKDIDRVYREPKGEWSFRSLQIMKDLGYRTYFWSADHYDFAGDIPKERALNNLLKRYHNGAIYLLHPKNKGNFEAMDDFITIMKEKGYKFGLVRDIKE